MMKNNRKLSVPKNKKKQEIKINRESLIMKSFGSFDEKYVVLEKLG